MDTSIEIKGLPEAVIAQLGERAEEMGTTPPDYVRYLIEEDLSSTMSMRILFAPVREDISKSGISDEELEKLIEEAREEVHKKNLRSHDE